MKINPELRRYLWLELTTTRLAGMPLVLLAAFLLAWLAEERHLGSAVQGTALSLFIGITYLWGMRQASEAMVGEIRERTWDWQRMSSIGPWSLTWGKFFGSTIYTWYGGLICLPFILLGAGRDIPFGIREAVALVLGALFTQGIGLMASLLMLVRERALSRSETSGLVVLAFFLFWPLFGLAGAKGNVTWYGLSCVTIDFAIGSLAAFVVWVLIGACSLVRAEFRMPTLPAAWCGFVLFMMLYCAGFARGWRPMLAVSAATAALLTYVTALLERKDPVALGRLVAWWRQGERRRVLERLPAWLLTVPFVLAAAGLLIISGGAVTPGSPGLRAPLVAAVAFLVRDLGLLIFLNLARKPQRADMFAVLCLGLLYGLVPGILKAIGADPATALFWPHGGYGLASMSFSLLEAAGVWLMVARRFRALQAAVL